MSGRHQPTNGADSDSYELHPYRVVMEDDDGIRFNVRIPAALGPKDARNQARDRWPYATPLQEERVE